MQQGESLKQFQSKVNTNHSKAGILRIKLQRLQTNLTIDTPAFGRYYDSFVNFVGVKAE